MKKKQCTRCGRSMRRYGHTTTGTPRWQCVTCATTCVRTRPDTRRRHLRPHFIRWLTGVTSLTDIGVQYGYSRRQLTRRFNPLWHEPPPQPPTPSSVMILIVDGVYLSGRRNAVLIARDETTVCSWQFHEHECRAAWDAFLAALPSPPVIVMDGQKGLTHAVRRRFPHTRIQRCLVHVERFVRTRISQRPKTDAGRELWALVRSLWQVATPAGAAAWRTRFHAWERRHELFLKERSRSAETGRWWYTHRKLRAARSHIRNALPYMFTFTEVPGVPRTTNGVEGGVNARLKELVRRHRGLSPERKRVLAAYFLASKTKKKSTRNVS